MRIIWKVFWWLLRGIAGIAYDLLAWIGRKVRGVLWFFSASALFLFFIYAACTYNPHSIITLTDLNLSILKKVSDMVWALFVTDTGNVGQSESLKAFKVLFTSLEGWIAIFEIALLAGGIVSLFMRHSIDLGRKRKRSRR